MRVLFWTDWYLPSIGGVETFSARLLPSLVRKGHEITVVAGHHQRGLPDHVEIDGVTIRRFWFHTSLADNDVDAIADALRRVSVLKRALAPDLVHLNTLGPSVLFHLQSTRSWTAPVLLTMHSPVREETVPPDTLSGRALRSASWVSCNSRAVQADLCRYLPEISPYCSVVHYGMDAPHLQPAARPHEPPRIVGYGRLVSDKGFDVAVRAFATVIRRRPDARLILAGDGAARPDLERLVHRLGLSDAVTFPGIVAPEDVPALVDGASLVVVPSRWDEPFGLVALEAALMARPVVATRAGGLVEVVAHGETGVIVDKDDPDALAGAILDLLADPACADRMGIAARARALERFSWDRCVAAYEDLYETSRRMEKPSWTH